MRIIGGTAAGTILKVPDGLDVRPMPDKVKLAVFNSLGEWIVDRRVLDLFAGTGALGLECLSRGARELVSVEKSFRHARFYRLNLAASGFPDGSVEFRVQDAFAAVHQLEQSGRKFDFIIADPPYGEKNVGRRSESLAQRLLDEPALPKVLLPDGLFVLGHTKRDSLELTPPWHERKALRHGDTVIRVLEVAS